MSYRASNLDDYKHCFFGREGGVSSGKYASLNVNYKSQDERQNVDRNWDIIASKFSLKRENIFTVVQGVSNIVVEAEEASIFKYTADGMVTTKEDILLCIKTADCAPVLLADYQNGVVGAAHAGWRGAYKGVVQNVVELMLKKGAKKQNIAVAIGPCLQKQSFEVMDDMRQLFLTQKVENEDFFSRGRDETHFYFDLSGYLKRVLQNLEIDNVVDCGIDTYVEKNGYFSYRRNTHQNLIEVKFDYPTQYSCIKL